MRKSESYRALFELAEKNSAQAEEISLLISGGALDLHIILRYARIDNSEEARHLAEKLAKRIPKNRLDQRLLIKSQASIDNNVRQLTRTLAFSIPASLLIHGVIHEFLNNYKNEYIKWLAEKLSKRHYLHVKKNLKS